MSTLKNNGVKMDEQWGSHTEENIFAVSTKWNAKNLSNTVFLLLRKKRYWRLRSQHSRNKQCRIIKPREMWSDLLQTQPVCT